MSRHKEIDYSYPTSPNAEQFGFKNGCWCVSVAKSASAVSEVQAVFATKDEAVKYARSLPIPFGKLWQTYEEDAERFDGLS